MFTGNGSISFAFKEKNRLENRRSLLDNSRMFEAAVLMGILLSGRIFEINLYTTGVYREYFKGDGWFLAVAESMCQACSRNAAIGELQPN